MVIGIGWTHTKRIKMGTSNPENRPWILEKVKLINPDTIIDVGAGEGTYARLLKPELPDSHITGIEVFKDNIDRFNLFYLYDDILHMDVRDLDEMYCDLVIFGDVLEHMTKEDALKVWDLAAKHADYAIINIPIIHFPQGELYGNCHETHVVDDWDHDKVLEAFPGIIEFNVGEVTGAYLAKFGDGND